MKEPLESLVENLIDYAGLFPPAALGMPEAASNYSRYRKTPECRLLGRFVVPVSRLAELESTAGSVIDGEAWRISALAEDVTVDLPQIVAFNDTHRGGAVIDAIELKARTETAISEVVVPDEFDVFIELPPGPSLDGLVAAVGRIEKRAKVRTGGVTLESIPGPLAVAQFLSTCARHHVSFKATAGLHHPVRCTRPLTYEPDSVAGVMHGFINVFLAAAMALDGSEIAELERLLVETDAAAFDVRDDAVLWRGRRISSDLIAWTRSEFAISFGSCSFEEPMAELKTIGWL